MDYYDYGWKPYVSVAERRHKAEKVAAKAAKKALPLAPVSARATPSPRPSGAAPGAGR